MKRYLLDTSALLTLRDDERGADQVAGVLMQADEHQVKVYGSFITLMEVFYRVWKDEGETEGRVALEQCKSLPIRWIHENENPDLLEQAAKTKATHPLSLADAWIAATAIMENGILMHKDPEFEVLDVEQHILPYK